MDKEFGSNFTEESSYSVISNEEIVKKYSNNAPNTFMKSPNNRHQQNQNFDGNQNFTNNDVFSHVKYSDEQMKLYCQNLFLYLRDAHPNLLNVFQNSMNGDYDDDTGRNTPLKFTDNHAICKLNFPGVIYQLTSYTLITISDEIFVNPFDILSDDYPGPLTIEKTTEEQIYSYLKDQMSIELQDTAPIDWDSGQLLINYLELMIKENGKPVIGNIVRLLNNGVEIKTADLRKDSKMFETISRNSFSRASSRATSRASSRPTSPNNFDSIDMDLPQSSLDLPQGPGSVTSMVRRAVNNVSSEQKLCSHMDKYRQFILFGLFEEAVRYATKSGIWDHAFALALRMNNSQLINEVLISFSRRAICSNDPLYTMHELMAKKAPKIAAANRGFSNNEMGDWRCHLGMILAVKKFRPEECRQSIESLGEKLSSLRSYYAAHLCYLLAGTPFGLDKTSTKYRRKFDLIGWQSSTSSIPIQKSTLANCRKLFTGLKYWNTAPEQCIKLTEVYEYALKFSNDNQLISLSIHLLPYKYLMVYKMLSRNQVKNAYEYCINIGEILGYKINWIECESINFRIVSNIHNLSHRLNSWLMSNEDSIYVNSDNSWLLNIDSVYELFCDKYKFWNPNSPKPDFTEHLSNTHEQTFNQSQSSNLISTDYEINDFNYAESIVSSTYTDHIQQQSVHPQRNISKFNTGGPMYQNNSDLTNGAMYQRNEEQFNSVTQMKQQINFGQPEFLVNRNSVSQSKSVHQNEFLTCQLKQTLPKSNDIVSATRQIQPFNMTHLPDHVVSSNLISQSKTAPQFNIKSKFENSAFRDIAPPSELPSEAIMTEPPRYTEIKHATSSIVDCNSMNHNIYHAQRLRYENQMKSQTYEQIIPNKSQHPIGEQYKPMQNNQSLPFQMKTDDAMLNSSFENTNANFQQDDYPKSNFYQPLSNSVVDSNTTGINSKVKQSTFMPSIYNFENEDDPVDCFTNYPQTSRSRSQSNGSVGSLDHQRQTSTYPLSRSRNSSESKDTAGPSHQLSNTRTLEPTKEETDNVVASNDTEKPKLEQTESSQSNWRIFSFLKPSKTKEVHLPKDNDKSLIWDETKKKWYDKSNPEGEKPITPPPILPTMENLNASSDVYQEALGNQFMKSRYKQATFNVKPSATIVLPPPNPTFNIAQNRDSNLNGSQPNENYPQFNNYNSTGYGSYTTETNSQYNYNDQLQINQFSLQSSSNPRNF